MWPVGQLFITGTKISDKDSVEEKRVIWGSQFQRLSPSLSDSIAPGPR